MSWSSWLQEQVRRNTRADDEAQDGRCTCTTGWSELGAWVFCCRLCMEAGMRQLALAAASERDQLDLEMDVVVESTAPPPASPFPG